MPHVETELRSKGNTMSHRHVGLLAITMFFAAGFTSAASASGCGCWWWQHHGYYVQPAPYVPDPYVSPSALAPAPIYVVRQGPHYSGPGVMVSYQTWTPSGQVDAYPYIGSHHYHHGHRHRAMRYHHRYHGPAVYPRRSSMRYSSRYHGPRVAPMSRRGAVVVPLPPRSGAHSDHRRKSDMRSQNQRAPQGRNPQPGTQPQDRK
jgi:hypothetical protein